MKNNVFLPAFFLLGSMMQLISSCGVQRADQSTFDPFESTLQVPLTQEGASLIVKPEMLKSTLRTQGRSLLLSELSKSSAFSHFDLNRDGRLTINRNANNARRLRLSSRDSLLISKVDGSLLYEVVPVRKVPQERHFSFVSFAYKGNLAPMTPAEKNDPALTNGQFRGARVFDDYFWGSNAASLNRHVREVWSVAVFDSNQNLLGQELSISNQSEQFLENALLVATLSDESDEYYDSIYALSEDRLANITAENSFYDSTAKNVLRFWLVSKNADIVSNYLQVKDSEDFGNGFMESLLDVIGLQ